jgi:aryl carrier-like protein
MATQTTTQTLILKLPGQLVKQMPKSSEEQQEVILLGLQQLRAKQALERYRRGDCTLAYAAHEAGVTLREMIPLAYAHGLKPHVDPGLLEGELTPEQAARL